MLLSISVCIQNYSPTGYCCLQSCIQNSVGGVVEKGTEAWQRRNKLIGRHLAVIWHKLLSMTTQNRTNKKKPIGQWPANWTKKRTKEAKVNPVCHFPFPFIHFILFRCQPWILGTSNINYPKLVPCTSSIPSRINLWPHWLPSNSPSVCILPWRPFSFFLLLALLLRQFCFK